MTCVDCPAEYTARAASNTAPQSINECQIKCNGGQYLAAANATQCTDVGTGYWNPENFTNYGSAGVRNQCPAGVTTIGYGAGADEANDCGHILNIGNYKLYLRSARQTTPALVVKDGTGQHFYGNAWPNDVRNTLHVLYNNTVYSIY